MAAPPSSSFADPLPEEAPKPSAGFTAAEARQARRLGMVLGIVALFFFLELAGAFLARSNVLKADALHLLMDVLALSMSLAAMRLAVRRPTPRFTFGLRRAEPVAAIFNAVLVLVATVEIVWDGVLELRGGERPEAGVMLVVSVGALIVNGISAWLLHDVIGHGQGHGHAHGDPGHDHAHHDHAHHDHGHHDHDHAHGAAARPAAQKPGEIGHAMNLRSARLHLLGDTLGSLAALVAAVVIKLGGPSSTDPLASFAVALILVLGAVKLLKDGTLVLLEAAPKHLPVQAVREAIVDFPGVASIHDMHVWTLGAGHDAIIVHVTSEAHDAELAARIAKHLRETFGCEYVTVQVEPADRDSCQIEGRASRP